MYPKRRKKYRRINLISLFFGMINIIIYSLYLDLQKLRHIKSFKENVLKLVENIAIHLVVVFFIKLFDLIWWQKIIYWLIKLVFIQLFNNRAIILFNLNWHMLIHKIKDFTWYLFRVFLWIVALFAKGFSWYKACWISFQGVTLIACLTSKISYLF